MNGCIELLKQETASPPEATLREQQRAFDVFRRIYNEERPQEALGQKTPNQVYSVSRRTMPSQLKSPEYPDTMKVRKLDEYGRLRFAGQRSSTTLSKLIAHEPVGVLPVEEDRWNLFYGPVWLAQVTLRAKELPIERRVKYKADCDSQDTSSIKEGSVS